MRAVLVVAVVLGFVALRIAAIFHSAFNWDEFVLFDGVARTLEDGLLRSGGRPGLAQLLVMPLVEGCRDEAATGHWARAAWLVLTLGYLAGLFVLLLTLLRGRAGRVHDAALGVALLALVPAFLEWSVQVRTDQLALCGAVWGGVALLRSEARPGLALAAGLAFGVGWLSSQKLAYAAALMGLLALGSLHVRRDFVPRREAWRAALTLAGVATIWLGYRAFVMAAFSVPETHVTRHLVGAPLANATQQVFPFYRKTIGYSQYVAMLPTLVPHLALLAALAAATLALRRTGREDGRWLDVAWSVLALGLAVGAFHAAAFQYFWMTLGLFPAVAGATAIGPLRTALAARRPSLLRPAAATLWCALAIPALASQAALLRDEQAVQRDSLAFVQRNFAPEHDGFHPEGGRFCAGSQHWGLWLSQRIYRQFEHPRRARRTERLLDGFRTRPPHYLIQSFRLNQFPLEVRRFFAEHYQPYRDAVFVPGRRIESREPEEFDLLLAGPYRWLPLGAPTPLSLDGRPVAPGDVTRLSAGTHTASLADAGRGLLVLSLPDPPGEAPRSFYPVN